MGEPAGSTLFVGREPIRNSTPLSEKVSIWRPTPSHVRARLRTLLVYWMSQARVETPLHLGTIAVFEAGAFVPQTFAELGVQPIVVRGRWAEARRLQRSDDSLVITHDAELAKLVARYTDLAFGGPAFLLLVASGPMRLVPPAGVREIGRGPSFRLFCLTHCGGVASLA
jgi:hypothetical protein